MYRLLVGVGVAVGIVTLLFTAKVQAGCDNCLYLPVVAEGAPLRSTDEVPVVIVSDYLDQQSLTVYTLYLDVRNRGSAPICDLVFYIHFERGDQPRLDDSAYALLPKINPGQTLPMVAVVSSLEPITGYLVYETEYNKCEGRSVVDAVTSPVTTSTLAGKWTIVEGTVTNPGDKPLEDVRAAIVAHWPNGKIRYARVGYLFPGFDLPAGATKFYREQTYEQGLESAPLTAYAQGYQ